MVTIEMVLGCDVQQADTLRALGMAVVHVDATRARAHVLVDERGADIVRAFGGDIRIIEERTVDPSQRNESLRWLRTEQDEMAAVMRFVRDRSGLEPAKRPAELLVEYGDSLNYLSILIEDVPRADVFRLGLSWGARSGDERRVLGLMWVEVSWLDWAVWACGERLLENRECSVAEFADALSMCSDLPFLLSEQTTAQLEEV